MTVHVPTRLHDGGIQDSNMSGCYAVTAEKANLMQVVGSSQYIRRQGLQSYELTFWGGPVNGL